MIPSTLRSLRVLPPLAALILLGSGCGNVGSTNAFDHPLIAATPGSGSYTFAVLPFANRLPDEEIKSADQIHRFETFYFACRLAQTLKRSPVAKEAYFSVEATPAVDFVVRGEILKSNGRDTTVAIELVDPAGTVTALGEFSLGLGYNDFSQAIDPGSNLWNQPVNSITQRFQAAPPNVAAQRVQGYGGSATGGNTAHVVDTAAQVERDGMLSPMTQSAVARASAISPVYINWQKERTRAIQEHGAAVAGAVVSGAFAVMGAAASSMENSAGNTMMGQNLQAQSNQDLGDYANARHQMEVAAQNMQLSTELVNESAKPLNVRFLDKVYALHGSFAAQLQQFRAIVKSKLSG